MNWAASRAELLHDGMAQHNLSCVGPSKAEQNRPHHAHGASICISRAIIIPKGHDCSHVCGKGSVRMCKPRAHNCRTNMSPTWIVACVTPVRAVPALAEWNMLCVHALTTHRVFNFPQQVRQKHQNFGNPVISIIPLRGRVLKHVLFSQAPSPESNPNSPLPVVTMVGQYRTIES